MGPLALAFVLLACVGSAPCAVQRAEDAPAGGTVAWRLSGPGGGGWIESLAWHPSDPDVLYVGCDVGGFYVSADAGRTYEIRNTGLRNYFVECIAVHPLDGRVILLGTEGGIFRTEDAGLTWQWVRAGFPEVQEYSFSAPIGALCFDPQDPDVAYAGIGRPRWGREGRGAVYRSDDAGLSWRLVSAGQLPGDAIVSDLEVQPGGHAILAATNRGVFRSEDGGRKWEPSSGGLPHLYAEELAFSLSRPEVVYVSLHTTARDEQPWNGGVYRSDDAGRTWRSVNGEGMPRLVGKSGQPYPMSSGIQEICVDPRDPDVVYAGSTAWVTDGVLKTTDGGRIWARVATRELDTVEYGWITQWGLTANCMAVSPAAPDRVAAGTSGHAFVTEDAGRTWQQRYTRLIPDGRFAGAGLEVTCLNRVVPDPVRPGRVYYCYMDIGLLISDDYGRTFRRTQAGMEHEGNCFTVLVDPDAPSTIWAATGEWGSNVGLVCMSEDDGRTWRPVGTPESGLPNGQVRHLLLDPRSAVGTRRLLCTSNGNGLYESPDGGRSWRRLTEEAGLSSGSDVRSLLMDPSRPDHMVAAADGLSEKGGGVYESLDGGRTWQRTHAEPLFADIQALTAGSGDLGTLFLAARYHYDHATGRSFAGGVFRSADGGRAWERVLDFRFCSDVAVSPADPRVVYVGTTDHPYHDDCAAEGVLKSTDGGLTWRKESQGLSLLNVSCVAVDPLDPSIIYAGTGGNSVFVGADSAVTRH